MKFARIVAWTAPALFMAALGVAGTGLRAALPEKPDVNAMIGSLCAYVAAGSHGKAVVPPPMSAAEETADTSLVIHASPTPVPDATVAEAPAPTPAPPPEPEPEPDPVDYARLNQDVIVVAETLERFNQKLLRMIAQARAEQLRAEAQKASTGQPQTGPGTTGSVVPAE
jgi:hypothetical protein